jgi:hypothetical protein
MALSLAQSELYPEDPKIEAHEIDESEVRNALIDESGVFAKMPPARAKVKDESSLPSVIIADQSSVEKVEKVTSKLPLLPRFVGDLSRIGSEYQNTLMKIGIARVTDAYMAEEVDENGDKRLTPVNNLWTIKFEDGQIVYYSEDGWKITINGRVFCFEKEDKKYYKIRPTYYIDDKQYDAEMSSVNQLLRQGWELVVPIDHESKQAQFKMGIQMTTIPVTSGDVFNFLREYADKKSTNPNIAIPRYRIEKQKRETAKQILSTMSQFNKANNPFLQPPLANDNVITPTPSGVKNIAVTETKPAARSQKTA